MHHTSTRLYRRALELVTVSREVIDALPTGYGYLADQLRRAASSVVLNFAEGTGKRTPRDRRRYFDSARGSAFEVAAAFDVAHILGATSDDAHRRAHDICDHLGAMLHRYR